MVCITPKEIAQSFVLNDIIVHEIILEAIQKTDNFIDRTSVKQLTNGDLIRIILNYANKEEELKKLFNISDSELLCTIKNEYKNEIQLLIEKFNQKK
jgi:DNA-directed RNA polymerase subunit E'/Rpb7